jgi:hypothetical protein
MSIEREKGSGKITFFCDSCTEIEPTDTSDFSEAWTIAKAEGWHARKVGGGWEHDCKKCARPS